MKVSGDFFLFETNLRGRVMKFRKQIFNQVWNKDYSTDSTISLYIQIHFFSNFFSTFSYFSYFFNGDGPFRLESLANIPVHLLLASYIKHKLTRKPNIYSQIIKFYTLSLILKPFKRALDAVDKHSRFHCSINDTHHLYSRYHGKYTTLRRKFDQVCSTSEFAPRPNLPYIRVFPINSCILQGKRKRVSVLALWC